MRGVDSNYAVSSLIDKELIGPVGRLDAPGRPVLYGTTEKFLRVFGLSTLKDLPETEIQLPDDKSKDAMNIITDEDNVEQLSIDSTVEDAKTE